MKNLAGHDVSVFLFQFVPSRNGISFVLNEGIAGDMYPATNTQLKPLVHACCETLARYKDRSHGNIIMDGNILVDGHFEVMLSTGLGKHFRDKEKQNLFDDAHKIAELLMEVMRKRSVEMENGTYPGPQKHSPAIGRTEGLNQGLEILGEQKRAETLIPQYSPSILPLTPDDLPAGVIAKPGYDHRGYCITFTHRSFGALGKIVLSEVGMETLMETEISNENAEYLGRKQKMMGKIITVIEERMSCTPAQKT